MERTARTLIIIITIVFIYFGYYGAIGNYQSGTGFAYRTFLQQEGIISNDPEFEAFRLKVIPACKEKGINYAILMLLGSTVPSYAFLILSIKTLLAPLEKIKRKKYLTQLLIPTIAGSVFAGAAGYSLDHNSIHFSGPSVVWVFAFLLFWGIFEIVYRIRLKIHSRHLVNQREIA